MEFEAKSGNNDWHDINPNPANELRKSLETVFSMDMINSPREITIDFGNGYLYHYRPRQTVKTVYTVTIDAPKDFDPEAFMQSAVGNNPRVTYTKE